MMLAINVLMFGLAAMGVFSTNSSWPDLLVAAVMDALAITAGVSIVRQSMQELRYSATAK